MTEPLIIRDDLGRLLSMAGCVCINCMKLEARVAELEAARKAWENKSHELQAEVQELESKTELLSPPSIEQCQAEARAAKAKIKELQVHIDRRCECGELVDHPENIHCGACA